jgi:hypothetical protein
LIAAFNPKADSFFYIAGAPVVKPHRMPASLAQAGGARGHYIKESDK